MASRWNGAALAAKVSGIQPGDIIGTTPEDLRGITVERFQEWCLSRSGNSYIVCPTDIVHVAISLGGDQIVEAVPVHGVHVSTLQVLKKPFAVYRPQSNLASPNAQKVALHARGRIGASYVSLRSLVSHLSSKWLNRNGLPLSPPDLDMFICSTFVVRIFDDALADQSPFHAIRNISRLPVFLPVDVVAAPGLTPIWP